MGGRDFISWILANGFACLSSPLFAQDLQTQSEGIGRIERGFWTRSVSNDLHIEASTLVISRFYRTRVSWEAEGVPGRYVTDTLEWRLPLEELQRIDVSSAPGKVLLEGEDQDSYCPLMIARFSCTTSQGDCGEEPEFVVCRYNTPQLLDLLAEVKAAAKGLEINVAD